MKLKQHISKYWGLYLAIFIAVVCLIGLGYLWFLAGQPDNVWWRFTK